MTNNEKKLLKTANYLNNTSMFGNRENIKALSYPVRLSDELPEGYPRIDFKIPESYRKIDLRSKAQKRQEEGKLRPYYRNFNEVIYNDVNVLSNNLILGKQLSQAQSCPPKVLLDYCMQVYLQPDLWQTLGQTLLKTYLLNPDPAIMEDIFFTATTTNNTMVKEKTNAIYFPDDFLSLLFSTKGMPQPLNRAIIDYAVNRICSALPSRIVSTLILVWLYAPQINHEPLEIIRTRVLSLEEYNNHAVIDFISKLQGYFRSPLYTLENTSSIQYTFPLDISLITGSDYNDILHSWNNVRLFLFIIACVYDPSIQAQLTTPTHELYMKVYHTAFTLLQQPLSSLLVAEISARDKGTLTHLWSSWLEFFVLLVAQTHKMLPRHITDTIFANLSYSINDPDQDFAFPRDEDNPSQSRTWTSSVKRVFNFRKESLVLNLGKVELETNTLDPFLRIFFVSRSGQWRTYTQNTKDGVVTEVVSLDTIQTLLNNVKDLTELKALKNAYRNKEKLVFNLNNPEQSTIVVYPDDMLGIVIQVPKIPQPVSKDDWMYVYSYLNGIDPFFIMLFETTEANKVYHRKYNVPALTWESYKQYPLPTFHFKLYNIPYRNINLTI